MSAAPHPEAAGLADEYRIINLLPLSDDGTGHVADCGYDEEDVPRSCGCASLPGRIAEVLAERDARLAARLTDDDVVEAAYAAMPDGFDMRAALSAAAAVIGGESK